jgi:hypothetical protein
MNTKRAITSAYEYTTLKKATLSRKELSCVFTTRNAELPLFFSISPIIICL